MRVGTCCGTKSIISLLLMKALESKRPFSTQSLMTLLILVCGRIQRSTFSRYCWGISSHCMQNPTIFTWTGQWSDTWLIWSATIPLMIARLLGHNWSKLVYFSVGLCPFPKGQGESSYLQRGLHLFSSSKLDPLLRWSWPWGPAWWRP